MCVCVCVRVYVCVRERERDRERRGEKKWERKCVCEYGLEKAGSGIKAVQFKMK